MNNSGQANDEGQPKPTGPKPIAKREEKTQDSLPLDSWGEALILRWFGKMPLTVRVLVYLLLVLVYVFNAVQDPVLMGQMYVHDPGENAEIYAVGYQLTAPTGSFITNQEGRWVLKAPHRLVPIGKMMVEMHKRTKSGETWASVGQVELCLPTPILGQLTGGRQYRLSYRGDMVPPLSIVPACSAVGTASASEVVLTSVAQRGEASRIRITINRIVLRNTDHQRSTAEVYFIVRQGGHVVQTPGLPSKKRPDTWLLLLDDRPIAPNNLAFIVSDARDQELRIELWDRDRWPLNPDDLLAEFKLPLGNDQKFPMELQDIGRNHNGSTITVDVRPEPE